MGEVITLSIANHVAVITLNRPDQLNTYTAELGRQWNAAYAECEANDAVRVIVVTGAGRAFCAGADMSGGGSTFDKQDDMAFSSCPVTPAWQLKKPVIAALNGHAIGIGFGLALQCDFRVVAEEAKYGLVQVRRGVLADCASHGLLPRMVGIEKAMQLLVMGRTLNGRELMHWGLASACVPAGKVLEEALHMAQELATQCAPAVAAVAKQLVWRSLDRSLDETIAEETAVLHHTMGQPDAIEGGMAFFEKRSPQWRGSVNHDWPDVLGNAPQCDDS